MFATLGVSHHFSLHSEISGIVYVFKVFGDSAEL